MVKTIREEIESFVRHEKTKFLIELKQKAKEEYKQIIEDELRKRKF